MKFLALALLFLAAHSAFAFKADYNCYYKDGVYGLREHKVYVDTENMILHMKIRDNPGKGYVQFDGNTSMTLESLYDSENSRYPNYLSFDVNGDTLEYAPVGTMYIPRDYFNKVVIEGSIILVAEKNGYPAELICEPWAYINGGKIPVGPFH